MSNASDQLYEVDLRQVERIKKLTHRLNKDLQMYEAHTQWIAQQESAEDYERVGLPKPQGENGTKEDILNRRNKIMLALKSAIWSTGNSLKSDHDRAKILIAQEREQAELEEE
jgi:hypothetical protein